jgi:hypothetical protein
VSTLLTLDYGPYPSCTVLRIKFSPDLSRNDCFDHDSSITRRPTRAAHRSDPRREHTTSHSRYKATVACVLYCLFPPHILRCSHRSRRQFISRWTCLSMPSALDYRIITSQTLPPLRRHPPTLAPSRSRQLPTTMVAFLRCPIALTFLAILCKNVQTLSHYC